MKKKTVIVALMCSIVSLQVFGLELEPDGPVPGTQSYAFINVAPALDLRADNGHGVQVYELTGQENDLVIQAIDPPGATITFAYLSSTGLMKFKKIPTSFWGIQIKAPGYYTREYIPFLDSGKQYRIEVSLQKQYARLELPVEKGTEWYVDGLLWQRPEQIPAGQYTLRGRRFGYADLNLSLTLEPATTTRIEPFFVVTDQKVQNRGASRYAFNPNNHGTLGQTTVQFEVSTPGSGRWVIKDANGAEVQSANLGPFTTWMQTIPWDGSDKTGKEVADGTYTYAIYVGEESIPSLSGELVVDRKRFIGPEATGGLYSGHTWVSNTSVLAPSTGMIVFGGAGSPDEIGGHVRTLIGLAGNVELFLAFEGSTKSEESFELNKKISTSIKWSVVPHDPTELFSLALGLGGSWDEQNRANGLYDFSVTGQISNSVWYGIVSPLLQIEPGQIVLLSPGLGVGLGYVASGIQGGLSASYWGIGGSNQQLNMGLDGEFMLADGPFFAGVEAGVRYQMDWIPYFSASLGLLQ